MEPDSSLPRSQRSATGPYPEPDGGMAYVKKLSSVSIITNYTYKKLWVSSF